LILDGQGQKMSKTRGNVVSPFDVLNQHGADATRWYLYTATPPGQERRFSLDLVAEVLRTFTLTLWNTYSFFVTYSNLDGWKPGQEDAIEYCPLDRWLRSALHALVRDVTAAYENYDVLGATRPIQAFVEQLSNWYLRRSRRRFWKSGSDADKQAAYATLYEALVTVAQLLAPTMPFISDEIYQNLVREANPDAPQSVHISDWPEFNPAVIDDRLNKEMALVMKLASLGHAARNKANRKVRQPLAEAAFSVGNLDEREVISRYADILSDELNVKKVRALDTAGEAVDYALNPLPKQLGQKYGRRFPGIRSALLALDPVPAAQRFLAGLPVRVMADEETVDILPEEVEVRVNARSGFAVAVDGATLAALVTDLSPELVREGLAREFVRRVQDLRKTAELEIADRIEMFYTATPGLAEAVMAYKDYIMNETLTVKMTETTVPEGLPSAEDRFDGESVVVAVKKAA